MVFFPKKLFKLFVKDFILLVGGLCPVNAYSPFEIFHHFTKQDKERFLCGGNSLKGVLYFNGGYFSGSLQNVLVVRVYGEINFINLSVEFNGNTTFTDCPT